MLENGFTNRGLDKFFRIFLANPHSKMIFLGVEMNTAHKNTPDKINKFQTTKNMPKLKTSFEDIIPHYQRASQDTRALNLHDEFRKHDKNIAITY